MLTAHRRVCDIIFHSTALVLVSPSHSSCEIVGATRILNSNCRVPVLLPPQRPPNASAAPLRAPPSPSIAPQSFFRDAPDPHRPVGINWFRPDCTPGSPVSPVPGRRQRAGRVRIPTGILAQCLGRSLPRKPRGCLGACVQEMAPGGANSTAPGWPLLHNGGQCGKDLEALLSV